MGSSFRPRHGMAVLTVCAVLLANAPAALAQEDGWRFGVGTGLMSFSLDGDIGFATSAGGVVVDVDLDNSDTADLFESAFGSLGQGDRERDDNRSYWAVGVGARYAIQSRTGVDLRLDLVTTSEDENSVYLALNQAF